VGGHSGGRTYGGRTLAERRDDQHARLRDAARSVFASSGYANASIEDIVAGARVSRSTFYAFFATKEDCLLDLFWHDSERLLDALRDVARRDIEVVEKVRAGAQVFVETLASDPEMAQVILVEAVGASERVEQARARVRGLFTALIAGQLTEIDLWRDRPEEAQLAAMATMAAMAELVSHLVATGRLDEWRSLVEPLERYALRALGPDLIDG
jgi:AcrR family transcriptional regulator